MASRKSMLTPLFPLLFLEQIELNDIVNICFNTPLRLIMQIL